MKVFVQAIIQAQAGDIPEIPHSGERSLERYSQFWQRITS
jgi:hypothetical protein